MNLTEIRPLQSQPQVQQERIEARPVQWSADFRMNQPAEPVLDRQAQRHQMDASQVHAEETLQIGDSMASTDDQGDFVPADEAFGHYKRAFFRSSYGPSDGEVINGYAFGHHRFPGIVTGDTALACALQSPGSPPEQHCP